MTISATATQALDRFDLDLRGFAISRLDVDGRPASFTRDGQELQVAPRGRLAAGSAFTVRVAYAGTPAVVSDATFFRILRDRYAQNRYGNVMTAELIALAEAESGRDLDAFFAAWLFTPSKPVSW